MPGPVKTVTLQVAALTAEANRDIARTGAYFDRLRAANPVQLGVKFDRLQAIAQAKILSRELSGVVSGKITVTSDAGKGGIAGLLAKLTGGQGAGAGAGGGGLAALLGGGGTAGAGAGAAGIGGIGAAGIAAGALGAIAALETGIAGIVPVLAAAAAGVASFGALAIPTFSAITTAYGAVKTATDAYAAASANLNTAIHQSPADLAAYQKTIHGLEPDLQNAARLLTNQNAQWQLLSPSMQRSVIALSNNKTALKLLLPDQQKALTALLGQKKAWDGLSGPQQTAVGGMQKISAVFQAMADKLAPDVMKVFNEGLKIAGKLLPHLLPFADAAATAIIGLLKGFDKFASSPGFKTFLAQLLKLSGPAITAIGEGLGQIAIALGKLLIAMINPNGIKALRLIFTVIAGLITGIAAVFTWATPRIIHNMAEVAHGFDRVRRNVAAWYRDVSGFIGRMVHDVAAAYRSVTHAGDVFSARLAGVLKFIGASFRRDYQDVLTWAQGLGVSVSRVVQFFVKLPGRIVTGLGNLAALLVAGGRNLIRGLLGGAESFLSGTLGGWVSRIGGAIVNAVKSFFGIHSPSTVMAGIGGHLMAGLAGGMIGGSRGLVDKVFGGMPSALGHLVEKGFVSLASLPGRALSALASIAGKIGGFIGNLFGGGSGGSGVTRWTGDVLKALSMLGLPGSYLPLVLYQMQTESGGNPMAINLTDSNAQHGDPSRGLMQTIMATFLQYAGPFAGLGIYNPFANIYAALNYGKNNGRGFGTGPGQIGSGHGYAMGGVIPEAIWGIGKSGQTYSFGERGPETVTPGIGGGRTVLEVRAGHGEFEQFLAKMITRYVRVHGGGDVQAAYGY